jgi:hypothetical protein
MPENLLESAEEVGDAYEAMRAHMPTTSMFVCHNDDGNDVVVYTTTWGKEYIIDVQTYLNKYWVHTVNRNGKISSYKSSAGF